MTAHDTPLLAQVGVATVRFLGLVAGLDDAAVAGPSRLPGWTRGHVLAHVGNQGEALVGVLRGAVHGDVVSMYPSQPERDAAIEAGAGAEAGEHLRRLVVTSAELLRAWQDLPDEALAVQFTAPAGWFRDVADAPWFRWRELALHAVDLDAGVVGLDDAGPLVGRLLAETVETFAGRVEVPGLDLTAADTGWHGTTGDGAVVVSGAAAALAAWLTGRSDGGDLDVRGHLPELPDWL